MKTQPTRLALALAATLGALAMPAQAAPVVLSASFSGSASAADTCGTVNSTSCSNGATSASPDTLFGSLTLDQFDKSLGVLTGTTLRLESTRTQTVSGDLSNGIASTSTTDKKTGAVTVRPGSTTVASGSSTARLTAPGASQDFDPIDSSASATTPIGQTSASVGSVSTGTTTNDTIAIGAADLNSYVGGGTVIVSLTAPDLEAESTFANGAKKSTTSSATYKLAWAGTVTAEYAYLQHAEASLSDGTAPGLSLDLDFGDVVAGSGLFSLDFSILNAVGDRVGLDLLGFSGTAGSPLTTNLAPFAALAAGGSLDFLAQFDASDPSLGLGVYSNAITLYLGDDSTVGASASRNLDYILTLNLSGRLIARDDVVSATVPEPGILSMLGIGLLGIGVGMRRRALR